MCTHVSGHSESLDSAETGVFFRPPVSYYPTIRTQKREKGVPLPLALKLSAPTVTVSAGNQARGLPQLLYSKQKQRQDRQEPIAGERKLRQELPSNRLQ